MSRGRFDYSYKGMDKSPLDRVVLSSEKETLRFFFQDGSKVCFQAVGDCCSHSWIEELTIPGDIKGAMIQTVEDFMINTPDDVDERDYEVLKCYQTKFRTTKGDIVVEYRNDSNGYYGGSLERCEG